MKNIRLIMLLSLVGVSTVVYAGHEFGNGGGVVVCRRPILKTIKSVELLDFYEARTIRGLSIDLGDSKLDWKAKVDVILSRLKPASEFRYQLYSKWFSTFEKESLFIKDARFTTIEDTAHVAVPNGCEFEQAAVQKTPQFPGDPRYYINDDLWQHMTSDQKAGLVLHEIIYREAMSYGHSFSTNSRYLLGRLVDSKFSALNESAYVEMLLLAHFEVADIAVNPSFSHRILLDRFWQASSFEKVNEPIELKGRLLFQIGKCQNADCQDFTLDQGFRAGLSCDPVNGPVSCNNNVRGTLALGTDTVDAQGYQFRFAGIKQDACESYFTFMMPQKRDRIDSVDALNSELYVDSNPSCSGEFFAAPYDDHSILSDHVNYHVNNAPGTAELKRISFGQKQDDFDLTLSFGAVLETLNGVTKPVVGAIGNGCIVNLNVKNNQVEFISANKAPALKERKECTFEFRGFWKTVEIQAGDLSYDMVFQAFLDSSGNVTDLSKGEFQSYSGTSEYAKGGLVCDDNRFCISVAMKGDKKLGYQLVSQASLSYGLDDEYPVINGVFDMVGEIPAGLKLEKSMPVYVKGGQVQGNAGDIFVLDENLNIESLGK